MDLLVLSDGNVRAIYSEDIDLGVLGRTVITRASHVEPDEQGHWIAIMTSVAGPVLGPFPKRSQALAAELSWLETSWLITPA